MFIGTVLHLICRKLSKNSLTLCSKLFHPSLYSILINRTLLSHRLPLSGAYNIFNYHIINNKSLTSLGDNCCVGITVMGNCVISVRSISASTSLMLSPNAFGSIDMSWLALSDLCLLSKCLLERCQTNLAATTHSTDSRPPISPPPKYK